MNNACLERLTANEKPRQQRLAGLSSSYADYALTQHLPPFMVFSVQLATELTSAAAPWTVLQAAVARAAVISAAVTSF
jgi:hypothetical protein